VRFERLSRWVRGFVLSVEGIEGSPGRLKGFPVGLEGRSGG
jgi:hypothetical protein